MNVYFLGGANEVGASCTVIEFERCRILVDAGIRMGPGQNSPLPDFEVLKEEGMPDAVLLTHAHTDHTGALPALESLLPAGVRTSCTPATKALTRVLLEDAVKRQHREGEQQEEEPLYPPEAVPAALERMAEVPWLLPVPICGGALKATWIPAGHILGAAMIYIEGKRESLLITGDVSVANQRTLPNLEVPTWCEPDAMVIESTYGNRRHKNRDEQEAKLASDVGEIIDAGGKVLIPAFAVGRSQEVILALKRAMQRKQVAPFPVYVDGMVRKVNRVYSSHTAELKSSLRRIVEQGEDLFYSDTIREVSSHDESESILSGSPCCIVASSGMLVGGKSSCYAEALAKDPKNLIAITGYQAEGTPGRALLDLAEAEDLAERMWMPNDETTVPVACQVKSYSLSAHADSQELTRLGQQVRPRKVFLVHGDDAARKALAESVRSAVPNVDVTLPENSRAYTVQRHPGISRGRHLANDRILAELSASILQIGYSRAFTSWELAEMWFGTDAMTPLAAAFLQWCLSLDWRFFARHRNVFYPRRQA